MSAPAIECMKHPGNTDPNCRTCWAADLVERAGRVDGLRLRIATLERRLAGLLMAARAGTPWRRMRAGVWSSRHAARASGRGTR